MLQEVGLLVVVNADVQVREHPGEEVVDFPSHVQYMPDAEQATIVIGLEDVGGKAVKFKVT